MNDRAYLLLVGLYTIAALYVGIDLMIYALVIVMFFEGVTGLTLPVITQKIRKVNIDTGLFKLNKPPRINFEAMRTLRIFFAVAMIAAYVSVHEYGFDVLWFFPWFFGFAILGAGASGVCPMFLAIRWLGFK